MTQPDTTEILNRLPAASWTESGEFRFANEAFADLLGLPMDQVLASNYWTLTAPGQKQREINDVLRRAGSYDKDFTIGERVAAVHVFGSGSKQHNGVLELSGFFAAAEHKDAAATEETLRRQNAILLNLARSEAIDEGRLGDALKLITEAASSGIRCERSSVWLYADNETKIVCHDLFVGGTGEHVSGVELFAKDFPGYFQGLAEDRTIAANDAHTHPATREFSVIYLTPLGINSMLEAPIRHKGKLIGVLCHEHVGPQRGFSQEEQNFAASVADMVARALDAHERHVAEQKLKEHADNLELLVAQRTRSIQLILDSTGDALIPVALDGTIGNELSHAALAWFGTPRPEQKVWSYLFAGDGKRAAMMELSFDELVADILPFELLIEQLPRRFTLAERTLEIGYRRVDVEGEAGRLLLVVSDVTASVAAERAQEEARELQAVLGCVLRDRDGFRGFRRDVERIFGGLRAGSLHGAELKRELHTLKGNSALVGLFTVARAVHELEDELVETGAERLAAAQLERLSTAWAGAVERVGSLVTVSDAGLVEVHTGEYETLLDGLQRGEDTGRLVSLVRSWTQVPVRRLLERLASQVDRIGRQLGKECKTEIAERGARLPDERLLPVFSTLVHVVRNAIDHGIESPEERVALGKAAAGTIRLSVEQSGLGLELCIADDGRGIDWTRVAERARAMGLPAGSRAELVDALLADGLSTREDVSELSGRGVGMSAVAAAVRAAGGEVTVDTAPANGTRWIVRVPVHISAAAAE